MGRIEKKKEEVSELKYLLSHFSLFTESTENLTFNFTFSSESLFWKPLIDDMIQWLIQWGCSFMKSDLSHMPVCTEHSNSGKAVWLSSGDIRSCLLILWVISFLT